MSPATPTPTPSAKDLRLVARPRNSRHVASGSIRRLLWQVEVFGFHLAGIDIRQGAASCARRPVRGCPASPIRRRGRAVWRC